MVSLLKSHYYVTHVRSLYLNITSWLIVILRLELEFVDTNMVGMACGGAGADSNANCLWDLDTFKLDIIQHLYNRVSSK